MVSGASMLISFHGTIPVSTAAIAIYSTVHTTSDAMIPIGKSRCGFFASCAVVLTASNPMYAKNMYADAALIPAKPIGANVPQSVPQFEVCTYFEPSAITNSTTLTLIKTMPALNRALSWIPTTKIAVMVRAMQKAGKLNPTSTPNSFG